MNLPAYGIVPFWFWNGDQNEAEISRQLKLAAACGVDALAVHARNGNKTDYMSDNWLKLLRHTCSEAQKLNLKIWIYDEENCPSGTVGNRIFGDTDQYRQKAIYFSYMNGSEMQNAAGKIAVFSGNNLVAPQDYDKCGKTGKYLVFQRHVIVMEPPYSDTLNPETVKKFMAMTHEIYAAKLGDFFGTVIQGIYTDDLNSLQIYGRRSFLPYSDDLPEYFEKHTGLKFNSMLISLVEDVGSYREIRLKFREIVLQKFLDVFVKPMRNWCENHGLPLSGHLSGDEGDFAKAITRYGAAMEFFREETIPGIDDYLLAMPDNRYMNSACNELKYSMLATCKQLTSTSGQYRQGLCSSEVLTSRGWGVPLSDQLAQLYIQIGLGIKFLIPHDFSYTTSGIAKRDNPASYFFQEPYFPMLNEFWSGIKRNLNLLSLSNYAPDTLVIHPIYTAQQKFNGENFSDSFICEFPRKHPEAARLESDFQNLLLKLQQCHYEYELSDEKQLAQAEIKAGKIKLGDRIYSRLVLANQPDLLAETQEKITAFKAQNGIIIQPENLTEQLTSIRCSNQIFIRKQFSANFSECFFAVNFGTSIETIEIDAKIIKSHRIYDALNRTVLTLDHCGSVQINPLQALHIIPTDFPLEILHKLPQINLKSAKNLPIKSIYANSENNLIIYPENEVINFEILPGAKCSKLYFEPENASQIKLDGIPLESKGETHEATPALHCGKIDNSVAPGRHQLQIKFSGNAKEPVYLAGTFAVNSPINQIIAAPAAILQPGDLSLQGLPFYWGSVDYTLEINGQTGYINISFKGGGVKIFADGKEIGTVFDKNQMQLIPSGTKILQCRLYNTAQNFFGPHKMADICGEKRSFAWSSATAWKPECNPESPQSFGVAKFGIEQILLYEPTQTGEKHE